MAAQVEGQADAAQPGDVARAAQVEALVAAPAMDEQHAGQLGARREQGAGHLRVEHGDRDGFAMCRHRPCRCLASCRRPWK
ncbi:Uncharacterised protein [Bordetella pertussis]|nr:Uncharacterised protein [Bordetella pertussis]